MLIEEKKIICNNTELKELMQQFDVAKTYLYNVLSFRIASQRANDIREYAKQKFKLKVSTIYKNI